MTESTRAKVFAQLQHVIAEEIEGQLGVERRVEAMPPLIAGAVLDYFDVRRKPGADHVGTE